MSVKRFQIVVGLDKNFEFQIHKDECRDVARAENRMGINVYSVNAETPEQAIADEVAGYMECQQDWYTKDFRIMPCCKDADNEANDG